MPRRRTTQHFQSAYMRLLLPPFVLFAYLLLWIRLHFTRVLILRVVTAIFVLLAREKTIDPQHSYVPVKDAKKVACTLREEAAGFRKTLVELHFNLSQTAEITSLVLRLVILLSFFRPRRAVIFPDSSKPGAAVIIK